MPGRKCIIALVLFAGGCAAQKPPTQAEVVPPHFGTVSTIRTGSTAGALAFDPPVAIGQAPLQLNRDDRQPAAFAGYDSAITTYFFVRSDDRETTDRHDRFERDAISVKAGVNYR
jgi:hypothetical protein